MKNVGALGSGQQYVIYIAKFTKQEDTSPTQEFNTGGQSGQVKTNLSSLLKSF